MRIIIALIAAIALVLCVAGCGPGTAPQSQAAKEQEQIIKLLPPAHANLKPLGNQWFSYDLEVGGAKRQFMARYWYGSHGEVGISVTELK